MRKQILKVQSIKDQRSPILLFLANLNLQYVFLSIFVGRHFDSHQILGPDLIFILLLIFTIFKHREVSKALSPIFLH
jgi:hypothetical protein